MKPDRNLLNTLQQNTHARLVSAMREDGYFEGHLSDSALAVALATLALEQGGRLPAAQHGRLWLRENQNEDGGWGDTPDSSSNLATTLLTLCALQHDDQGTRSRQRAEAWLIARTEGLEPHRIARAVARFYGRDKTFSAPILSICAMSGLLGAEPRAWRHVMSLPFEAACLPHSFYKWIRLPVVSYALPALIAIGLSRHRKAPAAFRPLRWLRQGCTPYTLRILGRIQPDSGGFLEAIPLTAFVALNLMSAGEQHHPVLARCLAFLEQGQRPNGAWPIDTNLATWTTSLAVSALKPNAFPSLVPAATRAYLLRVQQRGIHPFTNAEPGGWGWTWLSGSVPDADDTSAALLALHHLGNEDEAARLAARNGLQWLQGLQNRDGGLPTFCRGWLNLPFDRSCPDITAHALAALVAWKPILPKEANRIEKTIQRMLTYLAKAQRPDGAWIPLWFGNQKAPHHENPVFGTARVIDGLTRLQPDPACSALVAKGVAWLIQAQNPDGGWGGAPGIASSIEETALALTALAPYAEDSVLGPALSFLDQQTRHGTCFTPTPIGLYFSSLWYAEALYPVIFTAQALGALSRRNPD